LSGIDLQDVALRVVDVLVKTVAGRSVLSHVSGRIVSISGFEYLVVSRVEGVAWLRPGAAGRGLRQAVSIAVVGVGEGRRESAIFGSLQPVEVVVRATPMTTYSVANTDSCQRETQDAYGSA
jgi:hypothetical protein